MFKSEISYCLCNISSFNKMTYTIRTHNVYAVKHFLIKVCHSLVFQTVCVRSLYIKITKQTNHHATKKKPRSYIQLETRFIGTIFVLERSLAENVQDIQILSIQ